MDEPHPIIQRVTINLAESDSLCDGSGFQDTILLWEEPTCKLALGRRSRWLGVYWRLLSFIRLLMQQLVRAPSSTSSSMKFCVVAIITWLWTTTEVCNLSALQLATHNRNQCVLVAAFMSIWLYDHVSTVVSLLKACINNNCNQQVTRTTPWLFIA